VKQRARCLWQRQEGGKKTLPKERGGWSSHDIIGWGMVQVADCLPSMCKAPGPIPSTAETYLAHKSSVCHQSTLKPTSETKPRAFHLLNPG
jgi:hypothetical protein